MGVLSWLPGLARKRGIALTIQKHLERSQPIGAFPGEAKVVARRVVALAVTRVPDLSSSHLQIQVLAAAALAVLIMESGWTLKQRNRCALALAHLLVEAARESDMHSYDEQATLQAARDVLIRFRELAPEPRLARQTASDGTCSA
jgi:hypothetical protein